MDLGRAGDIDAALRKADVTVEDEVGVHSSTAAPMEPLCEAGEWDGRLGRLTLTDTPRTPHATRWQVATALGLNGTDVRVVVRRRGAPPGSRWLVILQRSSSACRAGASDTRWPLKSSRFYLL